MIYVEGGGFIGAITTNNIENAKQERRKIALERKLIEAAPLSLGETEP